MAPSINASLLNDSVAQVALNCRLGFGSITPLREVEQVAAWGSLKDGTVKSIFPYGGKWFNWIDDTDVCPSSVASDAYDRVYLTGNDGSIIPQYTSNDIAGGVNSPNQTYNLGVPAPITAPTVSITAPGTTAFTDTTLQQAREYVYTYITRYGEEGPPSPPSELISLYPDQTADVSDLLIGGPATPEHGVGYSNIVSMRIYRTNTGTATTAYQFVKEILISDGDSAVDDVESANLGDVLPSENWTPPPAGLKGIITLPCGALAGFYDNVLCFSEPFQPHAWPAPYQISVDHEIVALAAYGNDIMVTTEGVPYIATGSHPVSMVAEKLEAGYACVSKRGMVDLGYGAIYPCAFGLMAAGVGKVDLVTKGIITKQDWMSLGPESIHAYSWAGKYVAFWGTKTVLGHATEGFVYDPTTGDFTLHNIAASAGYHDPLTGDLYIVAGEIPSQYVAVWDGADTNAAATWKSKKFPSGNSLLTCCKIKADSYPVSVSLYADGVKVMDSHQVGGSNAFRLPGGVRPDVYEIEIVADTGVNLIAMAGSMAELAGL